MTLEYPYRKPDSEKYWYERIADVPALEAVILSQGDIIKDCPRYVPIKSLLNEITWQLWRYDVIILSQSCDLAKGDLVDVDVCPVSPLRKFILDGLSGFMPKHEKEIIRDKDGKITLETVKKTIAVRIKSFKVDVAYRRNLRYYLLDRCYYGEYKGDYILVDFGDHFTVNIGELRKAAYDNNGRIGLQSPYVEELSQAFGLMYMRIGLPVVINKKSFKDEDFPLEDIPGSVFDELKKEGVINGK